MEREPERSFLAFQAADAAKRSGHESWKGCHAERAPRKCGEALSESDRACLDCNLRWPASKKARTVDPSFRPYYGVRFVSASTIKERLSLLFVGPLGQACFFFFSRSDLPPSY
jgi:hypothetical protein